MRDNDKIAIEEIPADAVIQALKCCASEEDNCHRCPFMGVGGISDICITAMSRAALDLIYRKQSGWISVEERLPDNDWGKHWKERKYYLVFTKPSGLMNVAVYGYKEHDWWIDRNSCVLDKKNYNEVTHWMPMPEPPDMKGGAE